MRMPQVGQQAPQFDFSTKALSGSGFVRGPRRGGPAGGLGQNSGGAGGTGGAKAFSGAAGVLAGGSWAASGATRRAPTTTTGQLHLRDMPVFSRLPSPVKDHEKRLLGVASSESSSLQSLHLSSS